MAIEKLSTSKVANSSALADPAPVPFWRPIDVPLDREGPVQLPLVALATDFVESSVCALFERVALATPDGAALDDGKTTLSYSEVLAEVRRLSDVVAAKVPAGRAVAVILPNAPSSVIAMLACLAARRCCLALNAEHPAERNAAILRSAEVHAAIVTGQGGDDASALPEGTLRIAFDTPVAAGAPRTETEPHRPDDPAIVLYTSGSEGQPKGIVLSQAAILTRVRNNIVAMHLTRSDRFLSLGALGTTAGLVASLVALLGGAPQFVVSASAEGASRLLDLIRERRVTIVWGVPALLGLLFEGRGAAAALASVRVIRTFGDRLLSTECAAWRKLLPTDCHLAITYGQTEATIAQWFVPREFVADAAVLPTGYLLPEHEYSILTDDGFRAADNEVGELVVRGRLVALGEWAHGAVVPGRLRRDPSDPRRRILPTGDLVRLRPDGLLQVIGRVDLQVKIHGQRVEPAEIQNALRRVPGVSDAAVAVGRDGERANLIAFVVARDREDTALVDRARNAIRASLPRHMQPSRLLLVEQLPLLPGGKVDRQELLKIEAATPRERPSNKAAAVGPGHATDDAERTVGLAWQTPTQAGLAQIWRSLLKKDHVGPDDDFLLAGGDSLTATQLVLTVNDAFDVDVPLEAVFGEASTIRTMAAMIDSLRAKPRTGRGPDLPLQAIDERMALARKPRFGATRSNLETKLNEQQVFDLFVLEKATGLRRMRPGVRYGAVEANAHGFRSSEIPLQRPPGTVRFAFLGDSTTFGSWKEGNETTWPYHALETLRNKCGGYYDHVNAAMPGNGIEHLVIQFRDSISRFAPDVVALAPAASGNRADWARRKIGYTGIHHRPTWLGRRWFLVGLIEKNLVIVLRQLRALSDRGKLTFAPHELRELSQEFQARLRDLVTECQKQVPLVVLLTRECLIRRSQGKLAQIASAGSRLFYEPYMSIGALLDVNDEFNRVYRDVAAETGALLVDIAGMLPPTGEYFEDSSHCTPLANAMIGEHVGRALADDPRFRELLNERGRELAPAR